MSKYIVPILFIVVGLAICIWHFVKPSILEKKDLPEGPSIKYFDYLNNTCEKERTYITDFKVWYKDKTIKIIEIKPYSFLITGVDNMNGLLIIPKLEAAEEYCKEHNYEFEYWT